VDEWVDSVDLIYSNSLDHSYDPIHCLRQWFKCLRPGGICILAWEKHDGEIDIKNQGVLNSPNGDLFQGTLDFYAKIIKIAGEMDGTTGLKYILNTEYMGATNTSRILWDMKDSNWGLWDYHFVIQKISNGPVYAPKPGAPARQVTEYCKKRDIFYKTWKKKN
jgi:SAM-dependent methyltransferase